jgi:sodium/bile acid cotransporter 7
MADIMAITLNSSKACRYTHGTIPPRREVFMSFGTRLKSLGFDTYMLLLIGTVVLASILPARGLAADIVADATTYAVALLFFIYGARLDTASILAGIANWRLQGLVLASTFIAFPIIGIIFSIVLAPVLPPEIIVGIIPPSPSRRWRAATCRRRCARPRSPTSSASSSPRCLPAC